jgi:hypothetical protein
MIARTGNDLVEALAILGLEALEELVELAEHAVVGGHNSGLG